MTRIHRKRCLFLLTSQKIKNQVARSAFLLCFILTFFLFFIELMGDDPHSWFVNGPSVSRHFGEKPWLFNDWHWGVGGEWQVQRHQVCLGVNGHFMANDSTRKVSFWLGGTVGYRVGNKEGFWLEPTLIVGGIKKKEWAQGRLAPFVLPYFAFGWRRLGFNIVHIPRVSVTTYHILLLQIKWRFA